LRCSFALCALRFALNMRTFIAIDLPQNIKDGLQRIQDKLKASEADVKWVSPENIHLTLKFLGEIDDAKLAKINEIMLKVCSGKEQFQLSIRSLGVFPKINFPRVIWVGIDKGDKETNEIAQDLEERIASLGIPKEKRAFSSHITIGRVRSMLNRQRLAEELERPENAPQGKDFPDFMVTKITLFKSSLSPKGPVYEALKEASLKAT